MAREQDAVELEHAMIGADLDHHKDGPIFMTVGPRTKDKLLQAAGKGFIHEQGWL
jgi:hypothetical protein